MKMTSLVDYILSLFSNEEAARSFVSAPGQAMTNAGLVNVSPAEVSSVVANAVPGLAISSDDPIGGLQQAVAGQHGFVPPTSDLGAVPTFVGQEAGPFINAAGPMIGDAGIAANTAGLVAGEVGAGLGNVVATDVGAGLATGIDAVGLPTGAAVAAPGLAFIEPTGGVGAGVGLGAQAGVGVGFEVQAGIGAQAGVGLGLGVGTGVGVGAQAGVGVGFEVEAGIGA